MRDELSAAILANNARLEPVEIRDRVRTKTLVVEHVGRVHVRRAAQRRAYLGPVAVLATPYDRTPSPVHCFEVTVFLLQPETKIADCGVAVTVVADHLVVGLPSNDMRIPAVVPGQFFNNDLRVPAQRRAVVTAVQPHAGIDWLALVVQRQDVWTFRHQPVRRRCGRRTDDNLNATLSENIDGIVKPGKVELPFGRLQT